MLSRVPLTLPKRLVSRDADRLEDAIFQAGGSAESLPAPLLEPAKCAIHPELDANSHCARCNAHTCPLCVVLDPKRRRCGSCAKGARTFFRIRVGVLLSILGLVLAYAAYDIQSRRARNRWDHTLDVAVIILRRDPVDTAVTDALHDRLSALEDRFESELKRYRPGAPRPFALQFFGPIDVIEDVPTPTGDGLVALVKHNWRLFWYLHSVDTLAKLDSHIFDSRVYVVVHRPTRRERTMVEGASEQGGRVGTVGVELDGTMADFPLIVVGHELLHTLGASDKYDASGNALIPAGLAEPDRVPLYPQKFVEVMARNRPIGPGQEVVPQGLDELAVGPATAREIGWLR